MLAHTGLGVPNLATVFFGTAFVEYARTSTFQAAGAMTAAGYMTLPRSTLYSASGTMSSLYSISGVFPRSTLFSASGNLATAATMTFPRTTAFSAGGTFAAVGALETEQFDRTTLFAAEGSMSSAAILAAFRSTSYDARSGYHAVATHTEFVTPSYYPSGYESQVGVWHVKGSGRGGRGRTGKRYRIY